MALADAVSVGLLSCRGGRIAWANPPFAALAGASPAALVGRGADAFLEDVGEGLPDWLSGECGPPAPGAAVVCRLRRDDGRVLRVELRPLGDAVWEVRDVSERAALECEVHRLGAELRAARQEQGALRDRLEREAKEREELVTVLSHELQTPLTVVSGFTRLLLSESAGPLTDEQRRFLDEAARSCTRLHQFIEGLLEATSGGGADGVVLQDADLAPVVRGVAELLRPLAEERSQGIDVLLPPGSGGARFDPMRIEQVLINLIGNALKHGRHGGRVRVQLRRLEAAGRAFVEVAVEDDGPGIPEADRDRIFEPYVRARGGDGAGVGLGLAICRRWVEAHGGHIGVESARSGGSRFAFTLPVPPGGTH